MSEKSNWKIIAASVAGTSHVAKNAPCQDFFDWQIVESKDEILIAVASDGAGSAKKGGDGAKLACQTFLNEICAFAEKNHQIREIARPQVLDWLKTLQTQFQILADAEKLETSDFACTLLAAIVQAESTIFLQIGDGAIIYSDAEQFRLFTAPQQGEYANSTNFVTDGDAFDELQFELVEKRIDKLAIFTDGLQRLALDFQTNSPHAPFFRPMFAPLRAIEKRDQFFGAKLEKLEKQLQDFLDSPKINERTDDDKTLILAVRGK